MRSPTLAQVVARSEHDATMRTVDGTEVKVGLGSHTELGDGDWALIGIGTVLRVFDPVEGRRLADEYRAAEGR